MAQAGIDTGGHQGSHRMDALLLSDEPVDFDALDGDPVQLSFLIVGPAVEAGTQVRVLSRIGRLMRDRSLRNRLVSADNAERFLQRLGATELSA